MLLPASRIGAGGCPGYAALSQSDERPLLGLADDCVAFGRGAYLESTFGVDSVPRAGVGADPQEDMPMDRAAIRTRLLEIVGPDGLLDDPDELLVYEYDASDEVFAGHHRPDFTVLPRTAEQVSAVVRLANEVGLPVIPRGAGTGLAGGALALRGGHLGQRP